MRNEKIAVVIYGLPGSGKGTQANLAANAFGFVNFDTGRYLESLWYDPKRQKEALVRRERKLFEEGKLNTPSFVLGEVAKAVKAIAGKGLGVVFSGSPRTMYEAERLIPILERLYGKKRVFVFFLDVAPKDSVERNTRRRLCSFCKTPLLAKYYPTKKPKHCPVCAGTLYKRTLDRTDIILKRITEYNERTAPVLGYLKKRKYKITNINGKPEPYKVFRHIEQEINRKLQ
ncbi:MAG: nucleoside monophosphate kinase [bacterium]|nr:nucleoside monophosphate kinase [bacterium]